MKNLISSLGIIVFLVIMACGDNGDPSTPSGGNGPFKVEFISNGGVPAPVDQTVDKGSIATQPPQMTNSNHEDFNGWYTNSACTVSFSFSTPIISDIKLYAKWGYFVGDTGPAGGKVFYVKNGTSHPDWKYFEAAPEELVNQKMVINGYDKSGADTAAEKYIVEGAKGTAIGTGKINTEAFINELDALPQFAAQAKAYALAANNVDSHSVGIYSDWFIPSKEELQVLLSSNVLSITVYSHYYWSSTQYFDPEDPDDRNDCAWALQFGTSDRGQWNEENKAHDRAYVRPVRSFFCSHPLFP